MKKTNSIKKMGISVVICCHNSQLRLPETLKHILAQDVPKELSWEVIVVDNASTDDTAQVAKSSWPRNRAVPLHIIREPKLGLTYARKCGIQKANYSLISFIDDDNWIAPNWLRIVAEVMLAHPEVGACGGQTKAIFESMPPFWFERFQNQFVVGRQGDQVGDVTWSRGHLWGAGLTLRKAALKQLEKKGFEPLLTDRRGAYLISGGDYEICYALRSAGWRIWYEPKLVLHHYMPANRLTWSYLRKLNRGHGATRVGFEPYWFSMRTQPDELKRIANRIWIARLFKSLRNLLSVHFFTFLRTIWSDLEGDAKVLDFEKELGYMIEILRKRSQYDKTVYSVWQAEWRT